MCIYFKMKLWFEFSETYKTLWKWHVNIFSPNQNVKVLYRLIKRCLVRDDATNWSQNAWEAIIMTHDMMTISQCNRKTNAKGVLWADSDKFSIVACISGMSWVLITRFYQLKCHLAIFVNLWASKMAKFVNSFPRHLFDTLSGIYQTNKNQRICHLFIRTKSIYNDLQSCLVVKEDCVHTVIQNLLHQHLRLTKGSSMMTYPRHGRLMKVSILIVISRICILINDC